MTSQAVSNSSLFSTESAPAVAELRRRMDEFYATTNTYTVFQSTAQHGDEWRHVRDAISERLKDQPKCRVLEFGAGRTGFGDFLADLRPSVEFTVQDVTPANLDFLQTQADEVIVGPIDSIPGKFDVIFSTFVLEHISNPRSALERLFAMLRPGGILLIFCPRYDVPFYLSHSADHYGAGKRLLVGFNLLARRLWTLVSGRPAFLIHLDPSVFHLPFIRDRDAIHWVSLFDLRALFRRRARVRSLPISSGGNSKQWFVKEFLTVNLAITRNAD